MALQVAGESGRLAGARRPGDGATGPLDALQLATASGDGGYGGSVGEFSGLSLIGHDEALRTTKVVKLDEQPKRSARPNDR